MEISTIIPKRVEVRTRKVIKYKEEHLITIKRQILQYIIIVNMYEPNNRVSKKVYQKLIEVQRDFINKEAVPTDKNQ
jgi:hypothetical protein